MIRATHTYSMKKNFLICGLTGWCMEIIFTAFNAFRHRDFKLMGQTSIWMFPIYSMAALIYPVYSFIKWLPTLARGIIYSIGFFCFEFLSGSFLKKHDICPWDYSDAKSNIKGVIRLDFAPIWLVAGLIFEKILVTSHTKTK